MILYHATTEKRALSILKERTIKKNVDRYYTKEENGSGYSTQGYVYLTPEITFAIHFADCHNLIDKAPALYIFRLDIPNKIVEPDYDELRYQHAGQDQIDSYGGALNCSIEEYKSCRVAQNLEFDRFDSWVCKIDLSDGVDINDITEFAGQNLIYVREHYTQKQLSFINSIIWEKL